MSITVAHPGDAPGVAEPPRPSSLPQRVADLFFSPGRLFAELREDDRAAAWLAPILVGFLFVAVVEALRLALVSDQQLMDFSLEQARRMGQTATPPPGAMEAQVAMTRVFFLVGGLVSTAVMPFIVGAILWVLFGVMLGGDAGYLKHVGVAAWASLASSLGYLVISLLQFASGRLDLTLDLSVLTPDLEPGPLLGVLRALGPFTIWWVLLLAIGGAVVNRRRGWGLPAAVLFALVIGIGLVAGLLMGVAGGGAGA
ncbi:MAG TPA: YIP1 family protein [Longimicrobium sp.]|jgi:hypothetical protein